MMPSSQVPISFFFKSVAIPLVAVAAQRKLNGFLSATRDNGHGGLKHFRRHDLADLDLQLVGRYFCGHFFPVQLLKNVHIHFHARRAKGFHTLISSGTDARDHINPTFFRHSNRDKLIRERDYRYIVLEWRRLGNRRRACSTFHFCRQGGGFLRTGIRLAQ